MTSKILVLAAVVALMASVMAVDPAQARPGNGSGGSGGSGSITVPDGVFGGTTTATVNPGGELTYVKAQCFQSDTLVFLQYRKVGEDNQAVIALGATGLWTSGSADCIAEEGSFKKSGRWRAVASTTFHASDG